MNSIPLNEHEKLISENIRQNLLEIIENLRENEKSIIEREKYVKMQQWIDHVPLNYQNNIFDTKISETSLPQKVKEILFDNSLFRIGHIVRLKRIEVEKLNGVSKQMLSKIDSFLKDNEIWYNLSVVGYERELDGKISFFQNNIELAMLKQVDFKQVYSQNVLLYFDDFSHYFKILLISNYSILFTEDILSLTKKYVESLETENPLLIKKNVDAIFAEIVKEKMREKTKLLEFLETKLLDFNLSIRANNCLRAVEIETLGELISHTISDLLKYRHFGKKTFQELHMLVSSLGLDFGYNTNNDTIN